MPYVARTPHQLGAVLKACRKRKALSQGAVGARVGLRQATISDLETQTDASTVGSLFKALSALGLELAISDRARPTVKTKEW